jgi:hypothetical protein
MKVAWKVYFWLVLILTVIILWDYSYIKKLNLASYEEIIIGILGVITLYSYVFGKKVFSPLFWKFIFYYTVASTLIYYVDFKFDYIISNYLPEYLQSQVFPNDPDDTEGVLVLSLLFSVPMLIANYRISQDKFLK